MLKTDLKYIKAVKESTMNQNEEVLVLLLDDHDEEKFTQSHQQGQDCHCQTCACQSK